MACDCHRRAADRIVRDLELALQELELEQPEFEQEWEKGRGSRFPGRYARFGRPSVRRRPRWATFRTWPAPVAVYPQPYSEPLIEEPATDDAAQDQGADSDREPAVQPASSSNGDTGGARADAIQELESALYEMQPEYFAAGPDYRIAELSPVAPRVLTYTTRDVIDNRISVPAQHSLVRLSKNPATNPDAIGMLGEVKAGRLAGIFCVNWKIPAQRARRHGLWWWTVIPKGEDAVLMLDPDNPLAGKPLIAFRRELDHRDKEGCGRLPNERWMAPSPARIDAA